MRANWPQPIRVSTRIVTAIRPALHHEELEEVGDQHGEHAAQHRVDRTQHQQHGHHQEDVAVEVVQVEAAHQHQELAGDAEEDPHVQQPAEHDHHAGRPADAGSVALLEQFGNSHHAGLAERLDAEPRDADEEHRQGHEDAGRSPGEAVLISGLGGVHAGDDAELRGRQRGDAQIDVHLPAGHQEVFHLADVPADHDAGDHRGHQVDRHDAAVDRPRKVRSHHLHPIRKTKGL